MFEIFKKYKHFYDKENDIILINADSQNVVGDLIKYNQLNIFDLILTDPPFGIDYKGWDDKKIFWDILEKLKLLLKENKFFIFWWSVKKLLDVYKVEKYFNFIWQIICLFPSTYSRCMLGRRTYAPIFVFGKGEPKVCFKYSDKVMADELPFIQSKIKSGEFKPTFVSAKLLQMFSNENELVFDPFMGFGGLALVCRLFNRKFVGIEKDEIRFKIAVEFYKEGKIKESIPEIIEKIKENNERQYLLKLKF